MTEAWKKRTTNVAALVCFCAFICPTFGRAVIVQAPPPDTADAKVVDEEATVDDAEHVPPTDEGMASPSPSKKRINAHSTTGQGANAMLARAVSTLGALVIVLAVFGVLFLLVRVISRKSFLGAKAVGEMVEILDVARLDAKTELRTIRWQGTLILVARGASGWVKLGERREDACESD